MHISIIIVNYNTRNLIRDCLKSILENPPSVIHEIIVVDNNSTDGSSEMIKRDFPSVKLLACEQNLGYGNGINLGFRISRGNAFLILNSDTKVLPAAIDELYNFMQRNSDAGIVAPRLINRDLSWQPSCRKFPGLWQDFIRALGIHRLLRSQETNDVVTGIEYDEHAVRDPGQPMGACLLIRRKALNETDPFDTQFYMYYEEVDLCYRLRKDHWHIYYFPKARVVHYIGKSFQKNMSRMIYHKYRSRFFFYKKHYDITKQTGIYLLTALEMIYRMAIYAGRYFLSSGQRESTKYCIMGCCSVLQALINGSLPRIL